MNITITFVSYAYLLAQVLLALMGASFITLVVGWGFLYRRKRLTKK